MFGILELYTIVLHTMKEQKPKQIRTESSFEQFPLEQLPPECMLHVFRFLYSAHRVFRSFEVYALTLRSNYDSLLSMNEFSVHFDLHRQRYQHLCVHRCLLEQSADTRNGIYTYLPLIFVYSTFAVSRLPETEEPEEWYMCCPGDQQTIVLTSVETYTSKRCLSESPDPDDPDVILTDPDDPHVHVNLPHPHHHHRFLINSCYEKNWHGIFCTGDIVEGKVTFYVRCPTEQREPIKLDTWTNEEFA